jgi:hypothetical protein
MRPSLTLPTEGTRICFGSWRFHHHKHHSLNHTYPEIAQSSAHFNGGFCDYDNERSNSIKTGNSLTVAVNNRPTVALDVTPCSFFDHYKLFARRNLLPPSSGQNSRERRLGNRLHNKSW